MVLVVNVYGTNESKKSLTGTVCKNVWLSNLPEEVGRA